MTRTDNPELRPRGASTLAEFREQRRFLVDELEYYDLVLRIAERRGLGPHTTVADMYAAVGLVGFYAREHEMATLRAAAGPP